MPTQPKDASPWRQLGFVLSIAFTFPVAAAAGYFIGAGLDGKFGTSPLFSLVFFAFGFVAALLELLRELKRLNRQ